MGRRGSRVCNISLGSLSSLSAVFHRPVCQGRDAHVTVVTGSEERTPKPDISNQQLGKLLGSRNGRNVTR